MSEISQYEELELKLAELGFEVVGNTKDFKVENGCKTVLQVLVGTGELINITPEFHKLSVDLSIELMLNITTYLVISKQE